MELLVACGVSYMKCKENQRPRCWLWQLVAGRQGHCWNRSCRLRRASFATTSSDEFCRTRRTEAAARGKDFWYQMSAFPDDDYAAAAEALERRQEGIESGTEAKETHTIFIARVDIKAAFDVVGPEAYGKTTLSPGHTWVDYSCSVTRNAMHERTCNVREY